MQREKRAYLIMSKFQKVSPKVDGNAANEVDEGTNNPLAH